MRLEWLYILRPTKLHVFIIVMGCQMETCVVPINKECMGISGTFLRSSGKSCS